VRLSIRLSSDLPAHLMTTSVAAAQQAGLYGCWFAENPFERSGLVSVAAVAKEGPDLDFGIGVLVARLRHPVVLAQDVLSADAFCPRPLRVGLGAGLGDVNRRRLGLPKRSGFEVMREAMAAIRALSSGGSIPAADGSTSISLGAPGRAVPVLVGAIGAKTIRFAAENADGVVFSLGSSLEYLEDAVRGALAVRSSSDPFDIVGYLYYAGDLTEREVEEHVQPLIAWVLRLVAENPAIATMFRGLDLSAEEVIEMSHRIEGGRPPADVIPRELLDELVLIGPADRCAERLQEFARTGLTELALGIGRWVPDIRRTMDEVDDLARAWRVLSEPTR
jgi:alkanesulfonate monooxygenase SsuD/methylene tetrahydromethanopterin reductase-like flavin-dependent oxidoreductase (luciferase family)